MKKIISMKVPEMERDCVDNDFQDYLRDRDLDIISEEKKEKK